MKKFFATFLLLIVIFLCGSFVYLKFAANGSENNYFNANLREKFARYPVLRKIIGLHYDGDGKYDYLGPKYGEIAIKVVSMKGVYVSNEILRELSLKIERITNKKTSYQYLADDFPFSQVSTLESIQSQFKKQNYSISKDKADLFLIIAGRNTDENRIGSTLKENSIVLFENSLLDATRNDALKDNVDLLEGYATSTLLHEFGHQIGLNHNEYTGCLMNEKAEFSNLPQYADIISDFCEYEKEEVGKMYK